MGQYGLAIIIVLITSLSGFVMADNDNVPHLDLEMTGAEYAVLFSQIAEMDSLTNDPRLNAILTMGKRNLDWLKYINSQRDPAHKISLSSAATQHGIPIDKPKFYNPDLISNDYQALLKILPDSIKSIVTGTTPLPVNPPVPDDQFILWGLKLDNTYQSAARWILMQGYLPSMAARRSEDVRGYYFLSNNPNIGAELQNWSSLPQATRDTYKSYLIEMCLNNKLSEAKCVRDLNSAISNRNVTAYYNNYFQSSKALWDSFFAIQARRSDVIWSSQTNEMHLPFQDPQNDEIKSYLSDNIQDEWKWQQWHLFLDFSNSTRPDMTHLEFEAGTTPHVNEVGGSIITMDANAPLTEYDVQWTIRHEFGHVLGFVDCYVEFYDSANQVMVSYQLDITNLMCSRRGHLKQTHFDELKRVYGSR